MMGFEGELGLRVLLDWVCLFAYLISFAFPLYSLLFWNPAWYMRSLVKWIIKQYQDRHFTILKISAPPSFTERLFLSFSFLPVMGKKSPWTPWYMYLYGHMCNRHQVWFSTQCRWTGASSVWKLWEIWGVHFEVLARSIAEASGVIFLQKEALS